MLSIVLTLGLLVGMLPMMAAPASASPGPEAICVPWQPSNPSIPHSTYSGAQTTLKGIARGGATEYYWDYGDGTPAMAWTSISNAYNLGVTHTYTGADGQLFIATLHVRDAALNEDQDTYPVKIHEYSDPSNPDHLDVRINMAIDEGLWYLHATMWRYTFAPGAPGYGQPWGYWPYSNNNLAAAGAAVDAFQLHGSRVNGDYHSDPYVETVQRGLNYLLRHTYSYSIGPLASVRKRMVILTPMAMVSGLLWVVRISMSAEYAWLR